MRRSRAPRTRRACGPAPPVPAGRGIATPRAPAVGRDSGAARLLVVFAARIIGPGRRWLRQPSALQVDLPRRRCRSAPRTMSVTVRGAVDDHHGRHRVHRCAARRSRRRPRRGPGFAVPTGGDESIAPHRRVPQHAHPRAARRHAVAAARGRAAEPQRRLRRRAQAQGWRARRGTQRWPLANVPRSDLRTTSPSHGSRGRFADFVRARRRGSSTSDANIRRRGATLPRARSVTECSGPVGRGRSDRGVARADRVAVPPRAARRRSPRRQPSSPAPARKAVHAAMTKPGNRLAEAAVVAAEGVESPFLDQVAKDHCQCRLVQVEQVHWELTAHQNGITCRPAAAVTRYFWPASEPRAPVASMLSARSP